MTVGEYEITSAATGACEFCGQTVQGRVLFELYGGHLWVCQSCYEALRTSRSKPYSRAMDKFAIAACGYYANRKMARMWRPVCTA
jgi:ribosome-binding protein aMBF1 (putative translation factor)